MKIILKITLLIAFIWQNNSSPMFLRREALKTLQSSTLRLPFQAVQKRFFSIENEKDTTEQIIKKLKEIEAIKDSCESKAKTEITTIIKKENRKFAEKIDTVSKKHEILVTMLSFAFGAFVGHAYTFVSIFQNR